MAMMIMIIGENFFNPLTLLWIYVKKNLKPFTSSIFIVLGISTFHGICGMDEQLHPAQGNKKSYTTVFPDDQTSSGEAQGKKEEWDGITINPFSVCSEEIKLHILGQATIDSLDDGTIGKLSVVCKEWQSVIKNHKIQIFSLAICQLFSIDLKVCERFLNGRLIYKPNANNDNEKIELQISDLVNPLEGTFDLSQCGNTSQYLSISTGYRKVEKAENANKLEIWLTLRFLVERGLTSMTRHFQGIFPANWPETAPVGIFWTWGGWNNLEWYEYLTTQTMDAISNDNLYNKRCAKGTQIYFTLIDNVHIPQSTWAYNRDAYEPFMFIL